jgi:gluconate kinase
MRDQYFDVVIGRISELVRLHDNLAVAQALFKNAHRRKILDHFPDARFIWVRSEPELIDSRLAARADHLAGKHYGELINKHFETPSIPHAVLFNNDGRGEVINQLSEIIEGETDLKP